jgi:peptide/nickel transport system ATP-binding protein/oligopeptide transport system ATP-binding protein
MTAGNGRSPPALDVRNLVVTFDTREGLLWAVNGVSYVLQKGETLGIVGESGSGKSVHALSMLRLIKEPPGRIASGEVIFDGQDLLRLSPSALRDVRGGGIGFVFQDPMTSLNPVLTIGRQISEGIEEHQGVGHTVAMRRAAELLDLVQIADAANRLGQYPHEFSGGMRQRVMIAIALACRPSILIADEPTTALDVTVQAEIIALVKDIKRELGMSVIWITHDLGAVAGIADTIQVMYAGRILERGPVEAVFHDPRNAYTAGLLEAARFDASNDRGKRLRSIEGSPPDMRRPPAGDPFAPRHVHATPRCFDECPPLRQVEGSVPGHLVAAWYDWRDIAAARRASA